MRKIRKIQSATPTPSGVKNQKGTARPPLPSSGGAGNYAPIGQTRGNEEEGEEEEGEEEEKGGRERRKTDEIGKC